MSGHFEGQKPFLKTKIGRMVAIKTKKMIGDLLVSGRSWTDGLFSL